MKKLFVLITGLFIISTGFSQEYQVAQGKFSTGIAIYTDIWQGLPEGVDSRTINQGVSYFLMYNHRFAESNFSGALGVGMGHHNLYSNSILGIDSTGRSVFSPIVNTDYKKSKISLAYIDFPVELRFKSKKKFVMAVGFKAGLNVDSHTKYKGDNFAGLQEPVKIKSKNLDNIETWRYGITGLIGYKWINVVFYYSLSKVFEEDRGPEIYPISVGISLRPF